MRRMILLCSFFCSIVVSSCAYAQPVINSNIIPQFMQGRNGTNSQRIPCAYWISIGGLTANATYRYYNQIVRSSDSPTTDGAGNMIIANTSGFIRTSSPGFTTEGNYGEFTVDASGIYSGWMITEPTGNARFIPGNYLFFRIMLNDGQGGTTVATRLTVSDSIRVLKLGTSAEDSSGTGLRAHTLANARDFVFLYSNTQGTGRPLAATFIENDSSDNSTSNNYVAFYSDSVNTIDGTFGTIVPNMNTFGVRRIERRGAEGSIVAYNQNESGNWPSGAATANPVGGDTPVVLAIDDVPLNAINAIENSNQAKPSSYSILSVYPNPFNSMTRISFDLSSNQKVRLVIYDAIGRLVTSLIEDENYSAGHHELQWDADHVASGVYFVSLNTNGFIITNKLMMLR